MLLLHGTGVLTSNAAPVAAGPSGGRTVGALFVSVL